MAYTTFQLSRLCVQYCTKELKRTVSDVPTTTWISPYLKSLPEWGNGIVALAMLSLRNFHNQSIKSNNATAFLSQAPLQVLFVLALLRACDVSLGQKASQGVVELRDRILELAFEDPIIVDYLTKVASQGFLRSQALPIPSNSAKSSHDHTRPPSIDPLYATVDNVRATFQVTEPEPMPHVTSAALDLPCGTHGVPSLLRLAPEQIIKGSKASSRSSYSVSYEVQQRDQTLNLLRLEFEAVVLSVRVGEDVRKFEKDLFDRYIK